LTNHVITELRSFNVCIDDDHEKMYNEQIV